MGVIDETNYGFTDQETVLDLNLQDYNARMYDSELGRFIQSDTIVSDASSSQYYNRYSYVNNNPINHNDPLGHMCDEDGNCYSKSNLLPSQKGLFAPKNIPLPAVNASDKLYEFLKKEEGGPKTKPYNDNDDPTKANCTIGYGTYLHKGACTGDELVPYYDNEGLVGYYVTDGFNNSVFVDPEKGFTEENAATLLSLYITKVIEPAIRENIHASLNQFQYDALVSFLYNCGPGEIAPLESGEDSQLATYFNTGHYDWALVYMTSYVYDDYANKLPILEARRREEAELFTKGDYVWDAN